MHTKKLTEEKPMCNNSKNTTKESSNNTNEENTSSSKFENNLDDEIDSETLIPIMQLLL